jgi:SAM-dependent methyltransferase
MSIQVFNSCFQRSGIAAKSDLKTREYQEVFRALEREHEEFLAKDQQFRSDDYKWPRDPLHCWSRVWEYPYVYYHLKSLRDSIQPEANARIADLGSGVTFFPFAAAKLGFRVDCLDIDPICERDLQRAASVVPHDPGEVKGSLITDGRLPLGDMEVDAVYCISVLEHIPNFESTIEEVVRILIPGGLFILTVDLDVCGYLDIGVQRFHDMRRALAAHFVLEQPEITTHPADMLLMYQGLDSVRSNLSQVKFYGKQAARALRRRGPLGSYPNLAVWAGVLRRKATTSQV